jgi:hypothetical protein
LLYICITRGKNNHFRLKNCYFHARNANIYKICELHRAIFSSFYNNSQPNFTILLILLYVLSSYGMAMVISFFLSGSKFRLQLSWNHPLRKLQPGEPAHPCDVHDRKISATIAVTQVSILKRKNLQIFSCDSVYLFNLERSQYGFW